MVSKLVMNSLLLSPIFFSLNFSQIISMAKSVGWTYLHFDDDAVIAFFRENYLEEFKDVVAKFHSMFRGEYKADLFRYYCLKTQYIQK